MAWADRALALNPERPDWYMAAKGQAAFAAGDDAGAIAALKQGPKDYLDGWVMIAEAAANLGDTGRRKPRFRGPPPLARLRPRGLPRRLALGADLLPPPARGRHPRRPQR